MAEQLYRWHWRKRLPERQGELFRVLARGKRNSCLVGFLSTGRAPPRRAPSADPGNTGRG